MQVRSEVAVGAASCIWPTPHSAHERHAVAEHESAKEPVGQLRHVTHSELPETLLL